LFRFHTFNYMELSRAGQDDLPSSHERRFADSRPRPSTRRLLP
jgi:hypothetical protein